VWLVLSFFCPSVLEDLVFSKSLVEKLTNQTTYISLIPFWNWVNKTRYYLDSFYFQLIIKEFSPWRICIQYW
jgi:hypothetical protein